MLRGIAWRLGFIFCLAVTVRVVAGLFAPDHPPAPRFIEEPTAVLPGDLPPTSPEMRRAIAEVQARGAGRGGAKLTYGHGADSVTVTPDELTAARAIVRRERELEDSQIEAEEAAEREPVYTKPGEPQLDPNPDAH